MLFDLFVQALRTVVVTAVLLLVSWLFYVVFNWLMGLAHGPHLGYFEMALIVAIVSLGGIWNFTLTRGRSAAPAA